MFDTRMCAATSATVMRLLPLGSIERLGPVSRPSGVGKVSFNIRHICHMVLIESLLARERAHETSATGASQTPCGGNFRGSGSEGQPRNVARYQSVIGSAKNAETTAP